MKRLLILSGTLWVLGMGALLARAQSLEIISPKKSVQVSLTELKKKLTTQILKIDDPVYGKNKEYEGFLLSDVLKLVDALPSDQADEIVFTARDGYSPTMAFSELKAHKAVLVYQEKGKPGQFSKVAQGKAMISPGPFYLVWEEGKALKDAVPWPYQLVKIEIADWAKKYARVLPPKASANSAEMKGFVIFKAECIRCHSINMQGGDIGPELNVPRNITEYWKPEVLKPFIHNVADFRLKSKMPSFAHLSDEKLEQVVAYIQYMGKFKAP